MNKPTSLNTFKGSDVNFYIKFDYSDGSDHDNFVHILSLGYIFRLDHHHSCFFFEPTHLKITEYYLCNTLDRIYEFRNCSWGNSI